MAKQLVTAPPSSSVARLLDLGAAARAVSAPPTLVGSSAERQPAGGSVPQVDERRELNPGIRPSINREFLLTPDADETFSRLVEIYRRGTGARLNSSHVLRVILKAVAHRMDTLEAEARKLGPMRLPSNARGTDQLRERFEANIADAFVRGMDTTRGPGVFRP
ncbi:MAG: hypothetical protein AB7K52_00625 [Phycisphaerales bacterium]